MKSTIKMSVKLASVALAAALAACGGGGGSGPTAVLAPGIWNKTDNATSTTKFIGVVTSSANGGDVWGVTSTYANVADAMPQSMKVFTGPVTASGENFATTQGTVLSFVSGFANPLTGQSLSLPKSASASTQQFDFGGGASYGTTKDSLWSTAATIDSTDWTGNWTRTETDPTYGTVLHTLTVGVGGSIVGTKKSGDTTLCDITGNVTQLEKAVVNVSIQRVCVDGTTTNYSGISFPEQVNAQNKVTARAIWLKGTGSIAKQFEIKPYYRTLP